MVLPCGKKDDYKKLWGYPKILKNNSTIVLTVIHSFGTVIEQLSLAFEIMVKCSHAGSKKSNKSVRIF